MNTCLKITQAAYDNTAGHFEASKVLTQRVGNPSRWKRCNNISNGRQPEFHTQEATLGRRLQ